MAKIQIRNTVKEEDVEKLDRDTKTGKVLQYLQTFYPWIKIVQNERYVIFARDKSWGRIHGQVCEFTTTDIWMVVNVVGESLATQDFADFLQSVYGEIDINLNVVKYVESERERGWAGL